MDKISVIMSVYNETANEIKKSIESILNQTYQNLELIIISDNPQNEEIETAVLNHAKNDKRIIYYKNGNNIGLALTLNRALDYAKGEYIARMDADDISVPNRLEKQLSYLKNNPDYGVVGTNKINIDENDNILSYGRDLPASFEETRKSLQYISMVVHPSVMFKKSHILSVGKYRNFPAAQDLDLWLRLIANNVKIGFINEYLIQYRNSTKNISGGSPLKQWLCGKYARKMYKQRISRGGDSFSERELELYLSKNNSVSEREKFKKSKIMFDKSRYELRNKNYMKGLYLLSRAIISHREMKWIIRNAAAYQIIKRKRM